MRNFIENKTVLITGATSGIGERLAIDLIDYNVDLVLVARNMQKLQDLENSLQDKYSNNISVYKLDVRNRIEVESTISEILKNQTIDILINNAGLALGLEKIYDGNIDNWDNMIDTNVKGLLYVSKPLISHMKIKDTAHIVNLGSVAGKTAYPGGNVYCATKASVHSLTEAMNADLFGTNIKVSTIAPGAVQTNFSNTRFDGDDEKADAVYDGYTPLRAEDISNAIINVINTPRHVNIQYLDIMPTAQRNPYLLDRSK